MEPDAKIYVAGHRGMVGGAILRELKRRGYNNFILRTSQQLDLCNQTAVDEFFDVENPQYVFLAAAKVGGIMANIQNPASFLYDNLMIECNVIHAAKRKGIKKLLFLGSSCIYPRLAPQPMREECLLDGKLEPTNEGYAIAKIAGLKLCEMYNRQYGTDFISVMPCNLFGCNDNFNPVHSHVVPALIRRIHEAKQQNVDSVTLWGTGTARRELLFVDALAQACVFLMNTYSGNQFFNVGMGKDISIRELAFLIKDTVGYPGDICFDATKPDGMPQKLMDVSKINALGWHYSTELIEGLRLTYQYFLETETIKE